jgi:hypothetical protein
MEKLTTLYEANVEAMDTLNESTAPQKNQAVLDELGENANGLLTYKGKQVGVAASLPPIEEVVDSATTFVHIEYTGVMTIETSLLPSNARVKKVEIPDVVNATDEYIQLEDMVAKDPDGVTSPYFIMYPKNTTGIYAPVAAFAVFPKGENSFYREVGAYSFYGKTVKIYYEIEE